MALHIFLNKVRVHCYIGESAHERKRPQTIVVSVSCICSHERSGTSDNLNDTLDYRLLYDALTRLGKKRIRLLERFVTELADQFLEHPLIEEVYVTAFKPHKFPDCEEAGVSIEKKKENKNGNKNPVPVL